MTNRGLQVAVIVLIFLPALAIVLWPLFGRGRAQGAQPRSTDDRRLELLEDKAAAYRALKELEFEHEAGHLSQDDYQALRAGYETRAATLLEALDALGPGEPAAEPSGERAPTEPAPHRAGWLRHPLALAGGVAAVLAFGVLIGLGVSRFTEPERAMTVPGGNLGMAMAPQAGAGAVAPPPGSSLEASSSTPRPIAPEMLAGMLQAARQSLTAGRYHEAIAAYQAVLKRDPRNVDAMTHMALIVAMGGHADQALESFGKALTIDPNYPPAHLYQGQVLYEVKQDYSGATKAWERFLVLVPNGEEHDQVAAMVKEARTKTGGR